MKRIIISVSNDLVTDQRVAKICGTLKDFGYEILLIGRMNYSTHTLEREYKTKRFRLLFNKGFLFYAEYSFRLFFFLLFSKKDILYANDLDTLLPNYLRNRRFIKLFWLRLEKWILPKLKHVITVSRSIKRHYESLYKIKVTVVRNLPVKLKTTSIPFDFMSKEEKIILYQGSTNIGRGLELAIDTMVVLEDYILVIIGSGDIIDMLKKKTSNLGLENKVKFLGKILPEKLKNLTPNAHIGISLEEDLVLN